MPVFVNVVVLVQPFSELTYSVPDIFPPEFWRPGLRVAVPLGRRACVGYVTGVGERSVLPPNVKCKEIYWPLEREPSLTPEIIDMASDLALRQCLKPGVIFGSVLPSGMRSPAVAIKSPDGEKFTLKKIREASEETRGGLALAFASGAARLAARSGEEAELEIYELRVDPPWPTRPGAKKQNEILEFLYERGSASRSTIIKALGSNVAAPLKILLKNGAARLRLAEESREVLTPRASLRDFELNEDQNKAIENLVAAMDAASPQCRLLCGVTGSGKTAVYLEAARRCLDKGKSVFLLAPEVALAQKLYADAGAVPINAPVFLYHGYQAAGRREKLFGEVGRAPALIIGTRSALFLPAKNIGLIILDEEHDASFKQDEGFVYHAKELAWFRAKRHKCLLVLGTATPDLKTYHAAENGSFPTLWLKRRVGSAGKVAVELISIGAPGYGAGSIAAGAAGESPLSKRAEEELRLRVARGEQAVALLNRRGYAPNIYCLECGKIIRCPQCEIGLTFHKNRQKALCHYCGFTAPFPAPCPECGKNSCVALGDGTERLAERLEAAAGAPVLRLDRDSSRRPGAAEEILAAFAAGKSPLLVGTQMLSKGHHFPNVTLSLIVDGDVGLNLPDYRAAERSFQLLLQTAGRAGRGDKPGLVLIQTRNVNHYFWQYLLESDYEGFYREELARRKKRNYPPFVKLGLIRLSREADAKPRDEELKTLGFVAREKARECDATALGPAPAPISLLRGRKRYQLLIKARDWQSIRQIYLALSASPAARAFRLALDLDPVNML